MNGCARCKEGEIRVTFLLSGPRSVEKRTFHLPCPACLPREYLEAREKLEGFFGKWDLTVCDEEVHAPRAGTDRASETDDMSVGGSTEDEPGTSFFRI